MSNDEIFCVSSHSHFNSMWNDIDSLLQSETLVDCTISAEGQMLKAHRIILSACSPYLKDLLSCHSDSHPILILNDMSFLDLKCLMEFMYKGEVSLKKKDFNRFIKSARSLKIKGLSEELNIACNEMREDYKRNRSEEPRAATSNKKARNEEQVPEVAVLSNIDDSCDSDREVTDDLLVPKSECPSEDGRDEEPEHLEIEEIETYRSRPSQPESLEDLEEQNWEPVAGTSIDTRNLPEITEGTGPFHQSESNNNEYGFKVTELPENYSWFDEDFTVNREKNDIEGGPEMRTDNDNLKKSSIKDKDINVKEKVVQENPKVYPCTMCSAVYYKLSSLTSHKNRKHYKTGSKTVVEPQLIHNSINYSCDMCSGSFSKLSSLRQHQTVKHCIGRGPKTVETLIRCKHCPSVFQHRNALEMHKKHCSGLRLVTRNNTASDKVVSSSDVTFICDICNLSYPDIVELRDHRVLHDPSETSDRATNGDTYVKAVNVQISGQAASEAKTSKFYWCKRCDVLYSGHHTKCGSDIGGATPVIIKKQQSLLKLGVRKV